MLREIHRAKLAFQFSDRRFNVEFYGIGTKDLWDHQPTFFKHPIRAQRPPALTTRRELTVAGTGRQTLVCSRSI